MESLGRTVCEPSGLLREPESSWRKIVLFDNPLSVWNLATPPGSEPLLGRTSLCGTYATSAADKIKPTSHTSTNLLDSPAKDCDIPVSRRLLLSFEWTPISAFWLETSAARIWFCAWHLYVGCPVAFAFQALSSTPARHKQYQPTRAKGWVQNMHQDRKSDLGFSNLVGSVVKAKLVQQRWNIFQGCSVLWQQHTKLLDELLQKTSFIYTSHLIVQ